MARMRWLVLLTVGCAALQPRHYSDPMDECRAMLRDAENARGFRNAGHVARGEPEETGQIDPCRLGCRIPLCGYPSR